MGESDIDLSPETVPGLLTEWNIVQTSNGLNWEKQGKQNQSQRDYHYSINQAPERDVYKQEQQ